MICKYIEQFSKSYILVDGKYNFVLDNPKKYKITLFLETDMISMFSMVYHRENMLAIESKIRDGCRVLLNRSDLMRIKYLECCIFEIIARKSTIVRPIVLKKFNTFLKYIDVEFIKVNSPLKKKKKKNRRNECINLIKGIKLVNTYIKNLSDDRAILIMSKNEIYI
jgi:hypothetical protein